MHVFNFITLFWSVAHPGHPIIEATITQQMYKKVSVSLDSWTTLLDGSEGVEVSCDWRRVGHVTTVLLSDWRWAGRWSAAWCAWRPAAAPPCDMTGTPGPASQPSWWGLMLWQINISNRFVARRLHPWCLPSDWRHHHSYLRSHRPGVHVLKYSYVCIHLFSASEWELCHHI